MSKPPRIVIIGNSAAGFSCCAELTRGACGCHLTVVSEEDEPAYNRNLLLGYLGRRIREEELFLCRRQYYQENKVEFTAGSKAAAIDPGKRLVVLKDNTRIGYDYLVIASGSRSVLPDIPGNTKEGVTVFYSLQDARRISQYAALSDTAAIFGEPGICAELAACGLFAGKEVKIVARSKPEDDAITEKQEWLQGVEVAEIIGEGAQLRAIKLDNGKAIGVSLLVYAGAQQPATAFLKDSGVKSEDGYIIVDEEMRTSLNNVFACGSVCRRSGAGTAKTWDDAVLEGGCAAATLAKICREANELCPRTL